MYNKIMYIFYPAAGIFPLDHLQGIPHDISFIKCHMHVVNGVLENPTHRTIHHRRIYIHQRPLHFFFFDESIQQHIQVLGYLLKFSLVYDLFFVPFPVSGNPKQQKTANDNRRNPVKF